MEYNTITSIIETPEQVSDLLISLTGLDISEDEAMFNFYAQCITGDSADNVQYFKGKGIKFAEKYFADCTTKYQYTRKLYELFKQKYKGKARQKYTECYHLLKLRTQ